MTSVANYIDLAVCVISLCASGRRMDCAMSTAQVKPGWLDNVFDSIIHIQWENGWNNSVAQLPVSSPIIFVSLFNLPARVFHLSIAVCSMCDSYARLCHCHDYRPASNSLKYKLFYVFDFWFSTPVRYVSGTELWSNNTADNERIPHDGTIRSNPCRALLNSLFFIVELNIYVECMVKLGKGCMAQR